MNLEREGNLTVGADGASTSQQVRVGVGAARYLGVDIALDLGDLHPTGHAALMLDLQVAKGIIQTADPIVGFLHRSTEKLFEARDYRQILMLANRHDWLSAFHGELGVALVVEQALGLAPPERATWARTLLAEFTRITALLLLLEPIAPDLLRWRENFVSTQQEATGNRVHPMITRIGGLARPLDMEWLNRAGALVSALQVDWSEVIAGATQAARTQRGIAVLSTADAASYGVTGPVGRASGLHLDLRIDPGYLAYPLLEPVSVDFPDAAGDAEARYLHLLSEIRVSLDLVQQCIAVVRNMGAGPVDVALPKVLRAPEGSWYLRVEGPLGSVGYLLVSTAERTPWRLKLRTPSFSHAQALVAALPGTPMDRLADALRSMFLVVGDIDR
jgi:NADH-quinone oxidoreductase subunit D